MPTYAVLSEEELSKWREELFNLQKDFENNVSYSSLAYFILEVYEYMQIYAFYTLNENNSKDGVFKNVKVSYKSLKSLFSKESEFYVLNKFKETADNLRHIGYKSNLLNMFIKDILLGNRETCYNVLSIVLKDLPGIVSFLCSDDIIVIYKELYEKEKQESYCKDVIYRFCNGGTVIMSELLDYVRSVTKLSRGFISKVILDVLLTADVTINYL